MQILCLCFNNNKKTVGTKRFLGQIQNLKYCLSVKEESVTRTAKIIDLSSLLKL